MSHSQRFHMGILLHVLYSNPKVLYAPNNTEVDEIIRKVTTALAQGMRINTRTCIGCYFVLEEVPACLVDKTMCICGIVYFPDMSFPTLHEFLPRCTFGGLPEYVYTGEKANTQQMNDSILFGQKQERTKSITFAFAFILFERALAYFFLFDEEMLVGHRLFCDALVLCLFHMDGCLYQSLKPVLYGHSIGWEGVHLHYWDLKF